MNGRIAFAVAIAIAALELLAVSLWAGSRFATPGYVFMRGPWPLIALMASCATQAAAGLILLVRRPDNRIGWWITGYAVVVSLSTAIIAATAREPDASSSELLRWLTWGGNAFLLPLASWFAFALAFTFPAGGLPSVRWRIPFVAVTLAVVAAAVLIAIRPGPLLFFPLIVNPLAMHGLIGVFEPSGVAATWYTALPLLLLSAAGVISGGVLFLRYLRSTGEQRVQIRWYIASGVVLGIAFAAQLLALLVLGPRDALGEAIVTLTFVVSSLPPIAMTLAIVRYRLYDIDVILNRAFVYGVLTALLAGIYTASIRLFNFIFTEVTGDTSDLSLVLTTLLLATTFTPIKGRLERIAARWLHPVGVAPHADGPTPAAPTTAAALLEDPTFVAALDARIRAALEERAVTPRRSQGPSRRSRTGSG